MFEQCCQAKDCDYDTREENFNLSMSNHFYSFKLCPMHIAFIKKFIELYPQYLIISALQKLGLEVKIK